MHKLNCKLQLIMRESLCLSVTSSCVFPVSSQSSMNFGFSGIAINIKFKEELIKLYIDLIRLKFILYG